MSSLTSETDGHAEKLRALRAQKDGDAAEVETLKQKLAEAEEEMELLRLQAERAALLEVQTEIANKLVEDLEVCLTQAPLSRCAAHGICVRVSTANQCCAPSQAV